MSRSASEAELDSSEQGSIENHWPESHRRIWIEKKPEARALWEAKLALRAKKDPQGNLLYTTRDWAAWVLTGAPE